MRHGFVGVTVSTPCFWGVSTNVVVDDMTELGLSSVGIFEHGPKGLHPLFNRWTQAMQRQAQAMLIAAEDLDQNLDCLT